MGMRASEASTRRAVLSIVWALACTALFACKPSSDASPSATADGSTRGAPSAVTFPPLDDTCNSDAECAIDSHVVSPNGSCCFALCAGSARPGNRSSVEAATKLCQQQQQGQGGAECPKYKCPTPPAVHCTRGKCTFDPT